MSRQILLRAFLDWRITVTMTGRRKEGVGVPGFQGSRSSLASIAFAESNSTVLCGTNTWSGSLVESQQGSGKGICASGQICECELYFLYCTFWRCRACMSGLPACTVRASEELLETRVHESTNSQSHDGMMSQ